MDSNKPPIPDLDRTDEIYARAIELAYGPSRRQANVQRVLNVIYYGAILIALAWIFSMVLDRTVPVRQILREVVNPNRQVHVGERILIHGIRQRDRQCELTRRWWMIDGGGRRLDYEAERFDAYGEMGREEETIGPFIPLDAMPGRGRLYGVLAYDCNPLQRALGWSIVSVLPALEFEILPRRTSEQ
ncbi:hypothetical protein [Methylobacterium soli]|uniref:Uncharacterized protein n=1 Tax=Methylobacterium soli TaxID=553447 RepID=A0A6L3SSM1_9HYPH|nr:hypothetical protein [Methylobacterium soli]KAB1073556.1 hypothetical protein F6X53_27015 [Methylobacterium soli]GJE41931.1 hypothetical protein AEGHOMDF_1101 [Methylobacterium soli]